MNSDVKCVAIMFIGLAFAVAMPVIFNNDDEKIAACMTQDGMVYYRGNCITEEMAKQ